MYWVVAISNRTTPLIDSYNPGTHLAALKATLEFAISPHARHHLRAKAMGIKTRQDSRTRIATRARDYVQGPNWRHPDLLSHIIVAFSRAFRRIGECRDPLYVRPMVFGPL